MCCSQPHHCRTSVWHHLNQPLPIPHCRVVHPSQGRGLTLWIEFIHANYIYYITCNSKSWTTASTFNVNQSSYVTSGVCHSSVCVYAIIIMLHLVSLESAPSSYLIDHLHNYVYERIIMKYEAQKSAMIVPVIGSEVISCTYTLEFAWQWCHNTSRSCIIINSCWDVRVWGGRRKLMVTQWMEDLGEFWQQVMRGSWHMYRCYIYQACSNARVHKCLHGIQASWDRSVCACIREVVAWYSFALASIIIMTIVQL